jgi:hypothetical protein
LFFPISSLVCYATNKLSVKLTNEIAGDPNPGVAKTLKIIYRVGNRDIVKYYNENDMINIPEQV